MPKGVYTRPSPPELVPNADGSVSIPLLARDGSVRAFAIIDAADAAWASQWRWHLNNNGYAARHEYRAGVDQTVLLHRELLGLIRGDELEGDHRDRNRLNDRRVNLRSFPKLGRPNMQNKSSYQGGSSGHRSVHWSKHAQQWRARIMVDGKPIHLGYFSTEAEADSAARAGRARLMPHAVD